MAEGLDDSGEWELPKKEGQDDEEFPEDFPNINDIVNPIIEEAKRLDRLQKTTDQQSIKSGESEWNAKDAMDEKTGSVKHKIPMKKRGD